MIPRTTRTLAAVAALGSLPLAACGGGGSTGGDTTTVAFATYTPPSSTLSLALTDWSEAVAERTDGRINIEIDYSASLLAADDTLEGVQGGRADGALLGAVYYENQLPLTSVTGIPYITENSAAAMAALTELVQEGPLAEEYAKHGVVPLFFFPATDSLLGAKEEPIMGLADLEGLSIRSVGTTTKALELVGANPVAIAFPELYESLERGVVDAYAGVLLDSVTVSGLHEVAAHVSNPGQGLLSTYPIIMNEAFWEGLDEADRTVMMEEGANALEDFYAYEDKAFQDSCDIIREAGGSVSIWPEAEKKAWEEAIGDTLASAWRDRAGESAEQFMSDYQSALDRHAEELGERDNNVSKCAATF